MLTGDQLATMTVRKVIFHDVPVHHKGQPGGPTLATAVTTVDAPRRNMLKSKLTRVLGGKTAYPILFGPDAGSPVPKIVRNYTAKEHHETTFVEATQALANHLHQVQTGQVSAGLLCAIEIVVDGNHGLILMKLEREAGAQLKIQKDKDETRFAMEVLDDLVLTDGTRLFKTAAFLRTGGGDDEFLLSACDSQHRVTDSSEMARFWIKYLGCVLREDPRVATSKFYNASIEFINQVVTDPVMRTELYDSLHAELRSNKKISSPKLLSKTIYLTKSARNIVTF
jgi:hypothetical protein